MPESTLCFGLTDLFRIQELLDYGIYNRILQRKAFASPHQCWPWHQVREACSILDLDVLFYPCPKDGPNWRPKVGLWACGPGHLAHQMKAMCLLYMPCTAWTTAILPMLCHLLYSHVILSGLHNFYCWLLMSNCSPYCTKLHSLASQQLVSLAVSAVQDGVS